MGRTKKSAKNQKQKPASTAEDTEKAVMERKERAPPVMENPGFLSYYTAQLQLSETDMAKFMHSLRLPLPVAFRFTGSRSYAHELKEFMKKDLFPTLNVEVDGVMMEVPKGVEWYPDELCWVFDCPRQLLRKSVAMRVFGVLFR